MLCFDCCFDCICYALCIFVTFLIIMQLYAIYVTPYLDK